MRITLFILGLCFLCNWTVAQNYYVASLQGEVYYQNKLLKKKDKVILKGDLRFKNAESQVKLSGPGGLHTLSAHKGRAKGNEFLITLSNELFAMPTLRETVRPSLGALSPNIRSEWHFLGQGFTFFNPTTLPIRPSSVANGQMIVFLHETNQGLRYQKADIHQDSMLVIHAKNFNDRKGSTPYRTLILQISERAVLDTLLSKYKTIDEVIESAIFPPIEYENPPANNQILDQLYAPQVINKRAFVKDMRFHIEQCNPKSQYELLEVYGFDEYIFETYGKVYMLEQVLAKELKLPE